MHVPIKFLLTILALSAVLLGAAPHSIAQQVTRTSTGGSPPSAPSFALPAFPPPPADAIAQLEEEARRQADEFREREEQENRAAAVRAEDMARRPNYEWPVLRTSRRYVNIPSLTVRTGTERLYINWPRFELAERRVAYNVHDLGVDNVVEHINVPCVRMEFRRFPFGGGMHVPVVDTCRERIARPRIVSRTRTEHLILHVPQVTTERGWFDLPTFSGIWTTRRGSFDWAHLEAPSNVDEKDQVGRHAAARAHGQRQRMTEAEARIMTQLQQQTRAILEDYATEIDAWHRSATVAADTYFVPAFQQIAAAQARLDAARANHGIDVSAFQTQLDAARTELDGNRARILSDLAARVREARQWIDRVNNGMGAPI